MLAAPALRAAASFGKRMPPDHLWPWPMSTVEASDPLEQQVRAHREDPAGLPRDVVTELARGWAPVDIHRLRVQPQAAMFERVKVDAAPGRPGMVELAPDVGAEAICHELLGHHHL